MTSLKEEIEEYIYEIHSEWYSPPVCNAGEILKLIEKRIDKMNEELTQERSTWNLYAYYGRRDCLLEIKRMLK